MNYSPVVIQLPLVRETKGKAIRSPQDISEVCGDLKDLAQETFQVLTLNSRNTMINRHLVSIGLADASLVHPREVFRPALSDGASAVVLVHNHPSGDPSPSPEDIRITRQLVSAGSSSVLDIRVLDHVVLGNTFFSMREEGAVKF